MITWVYNGYYMKEYKDGKFIRFVPKDEIRLDWDCIIQE